MNHLRKVFVAIVAASLLAASAGVANAAEIKVLGAVAVKAPLDELVAGFERALGHKVAVAYATAGVLRDRIKGGEVFDVTILPRPFMDTLVAQGAVTPSSTAMFGQSLVSVDARIGAPKPDISTVEAFKRTMLAAKSISYADPAHRRSPKS